MGRRKTKTPFKRDVKDSKRERIVIRMILLSGACIMLGLTVLISTYLPVSLFAAFVLHFIGISFIYIAILAICAFFLYASFVVVFLNPQRLRKSSVFNFAIVGILMLALTVPLLIFCVNETGKSIRDMQSYANQDWQVTEAAVVSIDWDRARYSVTNRAWLHTTAGELSLFRNRRVTVGGTYRITYLNETKAVVKMEKMSE